MARENKPGHPNRKLNLRGHDKSRAAVRFGVVGYERGGWSLGWTAARCKSGTGDLPRSSKNKPVPIGASPDRICFEVNRG